MPKKFCNYKGCKCLIAMNKTYCDEHTLQQEEDTKERHRHYRSHRNDKQEQDFYAGKEWPPVREKAKSRDDGLCVLCFEFMDCVHHIIELKEDFSLRIQLENLSSLCDSCHNHVHREYRKNKDSKKRMQERLRKAITNSNDN